MKKSIKNTILTGLAVGLMLAVTACGSSNTAGSADAGSDTAADNGKKVYRTLDEIKESGENFFHADYEATLVDTYGLDYEDSLVVEGGVVAAE